MAEGEVPVGGLERVLEDLRALSGEVTTAAVLSGDGDLRASTLPPGIDRERYGAMLAALSGLAGRTARVNGGGRFAQTRVRTSEGHVLLVGLDSGGTLVTTTGPDARVGLVLYDMRNVREELEKAMGPGTDAGDGGQA